MLLVRTFVKKQAGDSYYILFLLFIICWYIMSPKPQLLLSDIPTSGVWKQGGFHRDIPQHTVTPPPPSSPRTIGSIVFWNNFLPFSLSSFCHWQQYWLHHPVNFSLCLILLYRNHQYFSASRTLFRHLVRWKDCVCMILQLHTGGRAC